MNLFQNLYASGWILALAGWSLLSSQVAQSDTDVKVINRSSRALRVTVNEGDQAETMYCGIATSPKLNFRVSTNQATPVKIEMLTDDKHPGVTAGASVLKDSSSILSSVRAMALGEVGAMQGLEVARDNATLHSMTEYGGIGASKAAQINWGLGVAGAACTVFDWVCNDGDTSHELQVLPTGLREFSDGKELLIVVHDDRICQTMRDKLTTPAYYPQNYHIRVESGRQIMAKYHDEEGDELWVLFDHVHFPEAKITMSGFDLKIVEAIPYSDSTFHHCMDLGKAVTSAVITITNPFSLIFTGLGAYSAIKSGRDGAHGLYRRCHPVHADLQLYSSKQILVQDINSYEVQVSVSGM